MYRSFVRLSESLASPLHTSVKKDELSTLKDLDLYQSHGYRINRAVGASLPEATSYIRQLEAEEREEQTCGKRWTKMVQRCRIGI